MSHKINDEIVSIPIKKLRNDANIPQQSKLGDAGADAMRCWMLVRTRIEVRGSRKGRINLKSQI